MSANPLCERQILTLANGNALGREIEKAIGDWRRHEKVQRLWQRDPTLWTGSDEARWLGWLDIVEAEQARLGELARIAADVRAAGFTHVVLLGMGGSSLCPEMLARTFAPPKGHPELCVLDSTDPAQVRSVEREIDLERTLFIVSSKSGTTLEPDLLLAHFFDRVRQLGGAVGGEPPGRRFIAITDPGSPLEQLARRNGFRHVCFGEPTIGGRFSALSDFGMVPAAIVGIDVGRFLERAARMVEQSRPDVPLIENPGVMLGCVLGGAARSGHDKITLIVSPRIAALGAWLEQLLAESTGKDGKALIPIDGELPGAPTVYSEAGDRLFIHLRLDSSASPDQDLAMARLEAAGLPVVRIAVAEPYDLGQELFRWEMATAVAGSVLGVNPFDQPDVEASKQETRALAEEYERSGALPVEKPLIEEGGIRLFADPRNAGELSAALSKAGQKHTLVAYVWAHLARLRPGDYFALLAYLEMRAGNQRQLDAYRHAVRDARRVATTVGFGPRFLHSTGQAFKGGPSSGVFLQITADDAEDLPVAGRSCTFGVVKAAQARGDFGVLAARGRRALRVHLGTDVRDGMQRLRELVAAALRYRRE